MLYLGGYTHYPVCSRNVSQTLQTLIQLPRLRRERLWQPGPPVRQGTGRRTSSCTVSWSVKLQRCSCFAGAACACPAPPPRPGRSPCCEVLPPTRHGSTERGKGQARNEAGRGDLLDPPPFHYPSRRILPTHPELGPCSSSSAQSRRGTAFGAARGRSTLCRAAVGTAS